MEIFGVSLPGLLSQLLLGLVNGSFYAILSLGLAVIFGLLNVINFAHGALFMTGALITWMAMNYLGINYWLMLVLAPLVVGLFGVLIERLLLRWIYKLDHLYGLLLTLGLTLLIEGVFRSIYGVSGLGYDTPELLEGATNLGFMIMPNYRAWVVVASVVVCIGTWYVIEKTKLGAYLRAGTENPRLVEAFGINVPVMVTLTYAFGAALAAFAGVLAAPVYQVTPLMGQNLIIVVFAVVVIGGMGSIMGSILTGLGYDTPELLQGATNLGFMVLPNYRAWVVVASVVVCLATWFVIEKTKLGAYLRAGTENPRLVEAFGVNVPVMITLTYAFGAALAAFAGVLAAPIYQVSPLMGQNLIIVVFAVVVIGGMGSIMGSILTGLGLGIVEGFTKVFYPEASSTVVFVIMVIVLLIRPAGLFGKEK